MRNILAVGALSAAAFLQTSAIAADIAIALTDETVEVDTSFAGARLTLFGVLTGNDESANPADVVAVVKGPDTSFNIRQLEKQKFIWMPGEAHSIKQAPGLYATASTKPIADIVPLPIQAANALRADYLPIAFTSIHSGEQSAEHSRILTAAFLNEMEDLGLYQEKAGVVNFGKHGLFTINIDLPATTPVGEYLVSVFLIQDGVLLSQDETTLDVNKVGAERHIYETAHERPVTYGLICVILSLFAGWAAAFAFRR